METLEAGPSLDEVSNLKGKPSIGDSNVRHPKHYSGAHDAEMLRHQNKFADVDRWILHKVIAGEGNIFLIFSPTRDVAEKILAREWQIPLKPAASEGPNFSPDSKHRTRTIINSNARGHGSTKLGDFDLSEGGRSETDVVDEWADRLGGINISQEVDVDVLLAADGATRIKQNSSRPTSNLCATNSRTVAFAYMRQPT
ncbi:unnamed protein product [Diatraea saccharalis]|uniref:Uncharacterized protein n=1 Tax=Diatraea saccharalis TaxID=40085 RepID=A0A9N9R174_9NEOP|nr:unnamed protein product [Diatraea saccharalis]